MISVAEARAHVLARRQALEPVRLPLSEALGCVVAEAIVSSEPVPPFTNSAMDGYALRAGDTDAAPVELVVVGVALAGTREPPAVGPGQAVRIMTGAPLPEGADAVCMVEVVSTSSDGGRVSIPEPLRAGLNVRPAGGDIAAGEEVFTTGTLLGPAAIGVLAGLGAFDVLVHPRPRVGVLSTGDELHEGAGLLGAGEIRDSNRWSLLALVAQTGCTGVDLGVVGDDEDAVEAVLSAGAASCDVLLTSGGVSVGDRDVVKSVLARVAPDTMRWMQVAVRPAKPFAFAEIGAGATPVFGLPGNPVSAMVSFELFARPALRALAGFANLDRPRVLAVADEALTRSSDGKLHLVRVVATLGADGLVHVASAGAQGSHQLSAMARANALALLADGDGVERGERVEAMLLDAGELATARDVDQAGR